MEAILNELALVRSKIEAMYAVRAQSPDLPELPIFYRSLLCRETDLLRRVNEPAGAPRSADANINVASTLCSTRTALAAATFA